MNFKKIVLLVFSGAIMFSLSGQGKLGFYGGYNFSKLYLKNGYLDGYKNYNSYLFGISYTMRKERLINMGFSVNYVTKSFDIQSSSIHSGSVWSRDTRFDLGIVNIEVFPELGFGKTLRFHVNAGPYVGYIVKAKKDGTLRYSTYGNDANTIESGNSKDDFNCFDIGVKSAAGISFSVRSNLRFYFETSYAAGLTNLEKSNVFGDNCTFLNTKNIFLIGGFYYDL